MSGPGHRPTVPAGIRLVTAEHVCAAVQTSLEDRLPTWAQACGLNPITTYQQLPDASAIATAALPAAAIVCAGLAAAPVPSRRTPGRRPTYDMTFRVAVAIYDRGEDHEQTAARARTWAGLVRLVLTRRPDLGGLAQSLVLVDEQYSLAGTADGGVARTLGGCSVTVDVTCTDVVPAGAPPLLPYEGGSGQPVATVLSTDTPLTVTT